jgi:integrase
MGNEKQVQEMMAMMTKMMDDMKELRKENDEIKQQMAVQDEKKSKKGSKKKQTTEIRKVLPIKNSDTFNNLINSLKPRNRLFVLLGVAASLRISDVLPLKLKDIRKSENNTLEIKEKKTGKWKSASFDVWNDEISELIHILGYTEGEQYLFESNKKEIDGSPKPISRQQASNIITDACFRLGLRGRDEEGKLNGMRINTHSLRKTFAYWFYKENPSKLAYLQSVLNHSDETTTLRYIGIEEEEILTMSNKGLVSLRNKSTM